MIECEIIIKTMIDENRFKKIMNDVTPSVNNYILTRISSSINYDGRNYAVQEIEIQNNRFGMDVFDSGMLVTQTMYGQEMYKKSVRMKLFRSDWNYPEGIYDPELYQAVLP